MVEASDTRKMRSFGAWSHNRRRLVEWDHNTIVNALRTGRISKAEVIVHLQACHARAPSGVSNIPASVLGRDAVDVAASLTLVETIGVFKV